MHSCVRAAIFVILTILLPISAKANSEISRVWPTLQKAYFDPDELAECLALEIINGEGPVHFNNSLGTAKVRRESLSIQNNFANATSWVQHKVNLGLVFHSLPLIDISRWYYKVATTPRPSFPYLKDLIQRARNKNENISLSPHLNIEIENLSKEYSFSPPSDRNQRDASDWLLSPMVDWLLSQPAHSVSHWNLIKHAIQLFPGDTATALGVLGELFDSERRIAWEKRKLVTPLGHRLKILFKNSDDPVGQNYHFWAHLNLYLLNGFVKPQLMNYFYESIYQNDNGDYTANYFGLTVGKKLNILLKEQNKVLRCKLD
jgi:hypothetical protein